MGYGYGRNDDECSCNDYRTTISRKNDELNKLKPLLVKLMAENKELKEQNKSLKKEMQGIADRFKESELAVWFKNTIFEIEKYLKELEDDKA